MLLLHPSGRCLRVAQRAGVSPCGRWSRETGPSQDWASAERAVSGIKPVARRVLTAACSLCVLVAVGVAVVLPDVCS